MIRIPADEIRLWPEWSVRVPEEIILSEGKTYHLQGKNGVGKSSLIRNYLLEYQAEHPVYRLYFEQQMNAQIYAVKAVAAFGSRRARISSEAEAVDFLLEDLRRCQDLEPRPVWIYVDESAYLDRIITHPAVRQEQCMVLYCGHGAILPASEILEIAETASGQRELRYGGI